MANVPAAFGRDSLSTKCQVSDFSEVRMLLRMLAGRGLVENRSTVRAQERVHFRPSLFLPLFTNVVEGVFSEVRSGKQHRLLLSGLYVPPWDAALLPRVLAAKRKSAVDS